MKLKRLLNGSIFLFRVSKDLGRAATALESIAESLKPDIQVIPDEQKPKEDALMSSGYDDLAEWEREEDRKSLL